MSVFVRAQIKIMVLVCATSSRRRIVLNFCAKVLTEQEDSLNTADYCSKWLQLKL